MNKLTRKASRRTQTAAVVLDTIGLIRRRKGDGVLRLKLVGPLAKLDQLGLQEGDRVRLHARTLSAQS